MKRRRIRPPAQKKHAYRQLWRIVDGAVADAFKMHMEYLTPKGQKDARASIVKRVVGAVTSYAEQSAKGRSVEKAAAANASPGNRGAQRCN